MSDKSEGSQLSVVRCPLFFFSRFETSIERFELRHKNYGQLTTDNGLLDAIRPPLPNNRDRSGKLFADYFQSWFVGD
jgi:hypothetical protein